MVLVRLAFRDFPVDNWTPGDMDVEASRLLRDVFPRYMPDGHPGDRADRRRMKRTQIAFCAALLHHTARRMRAKRIERFALMPEKDREKARTAAEKTLARVALREITPDQIIEET